MAIGPYNTLFYTSPDLKNILKYLILDNNSARPIPVYIIERYCFGKEECRNVMPSAIIPITRI